MQAYFCTFRLCTSVSYQSIPRCKSLKQIAQQHFKPPPIFPSPPNIRLIIHRISLSKQQRPANIMREGILMLDMQLVCVILPIRVCLCFSLLFSCVDGILVKHLNEQIFRTKLRCGRTMPWRAPRVEIKRSGNRNAKQTRLWLFLKIFMISSEACLRIFIEHCPLEQFAWT